MLKFNSKTAIKVAYFSSGVSDNGTPYSVVAFSEKQNRRDNDKGTKDALIKIWNPVIDGEIKDGAYINVLSLKIDLDNDDGFKFKHNEAEGKSRLSGEPITVHKMGSTDNGTAHSLCLSTQKGEANAKSV